MTEQLLRRYSRNERQIKRVVPWLPMTHRSKRLYHQSRTISSTTRSIARPTPDKLAAIGRALGHQVRIKRRDDEYGLYTVSEVRPESPDNLVRMGKGGRERLGTSDDFDATLDSQVPHPTFSDAEAECNGEFVERLEDNGTHTGLIAIAPHGGDIEAL
jgi:hypothetical protein